MHPERIARCTECKFVVVLLVTPRCVALETLPGTSCWARGPDGYVCRGPLAWAPNELQAVFMLGGWDALVAMVDADPALGWAPFAQDRGVHA